MPHLTRYYMYKRIKECSKEQNLLPLKGKILGISGIRNFYRFIDMKNAELIEADYPEVDMQNMPYESDSFDFVISDQVIEHVENPMRAVSDSHRVLKKDGIAIHTTCFVNFIHFGPMDYWRFSPDSLRYLCKDFSKILCCEGWGNRMAIVLCLIGDRLRFLRIPETKWSLRHLLATYNEVLYPIVTWIIAQK